jgi:hypothetical protein
MRILLFLFLLLPSCCCIGNHLATNIAYSPSVLKKSVREKEAKSGSAPCMASVDTEGGRSTGTDSEVMTTNSLASLDLNDDAKASAFETEFVHQVYDVIAPHFSNTRHSPWPKVAEFLMGLEPGSLIADVGCGNGKYMCINSRTITLGSDRSAPLAALAAERNGGQEVCVADNLNLPYRDGVFDAVLSIAVLHHLSRQETSIAARALMTAHFGVRHQRASNDSTPHHQ